MEKTHLLARSHIAGALAGLLGPFADQCETFCNCSSKACAALQLHEDDPVTEPGMLGSQQTQDGAASKDNTVLKTAGERKGPQLHICRSDQVFSGLGHASFLPLSGRVFRPSSCF